MAEPGERPTGWKPTVHQTVVMVGGEKNMGTAVVLSFLFGPLGMLYSTVGGAIVMFGVAVILNFSISFWAVLAGIPVNVAQRGTGRTDKGTGGRGHRA